MSDDDASELLTTIEVARIFRVARNTVTGWAKAGLLEYTRTPTGQLRFYRRSVERVLRDGHHDGPRHRHQHVGSRTDELDFDRSGAER